ncbi:MAG: glutamate 5-kinase [Planctomycetaceae bacterium]|nr:glutamate 5-kinase [Planctomycetaceae bacterium]
MNAPGNLVRREVIETAETLVIKIGTNVLSRDDATLDIERIADLVAQIQRVLATGRKVVIVSSGAVGAGIDVLELGGRPEDLRHLQAAAAAGQARLIHHYDDCLRQHGAHAAQLLLTADDFSERDRYLNVRNTLNTLFEYGAVPIVNENDTTSVAEIGFGDNDHLASLVTNLLSSPLLVLLTVVDGLYRSVDEPEPLPLVENWDDGLFDLVQDQRSQGGRGGMRGKLEAVRNATAVGESVIMANGTRPGVLDEILSGQEVGTLFLAHGSTMPAWKRWIGYASTPQGRLTLDEGACRALAVNGSSLLPIGLIGVEGDFARGDVVTLLDPTGHEFARGLSNYDAGETTTIAGQRSEKIPQLLGSLPYVEVIHRDNLVLID